MNEKRNIGIDLIKIIACVLVIMLHSLNPTEPAVVNNTFNLILYYMGTLAIPVFFMASGYFVLNKAAISYVYSFKRIKSILIVVLSWLFLYSLVVFVFKHKFTFLNEIEGSAFTGVPDSHFYHFWFFWALILMLLIAPILVWILQKSFRYFIALIIIVTIICLIQDISLHMGYTYLMQNTPQVFRINIWIEYYLLGGLVGNAHFDQIKTFVERYFIQFSILDIILYVALIMYSLWNRQIIGWAYAEANYNNILVIIISLISMTLFATSKPQAQKAIEYIIPATMGIYILQSFFITYLSKIMFFSMYPVFLIPVVFVACLVIVKLALRIPIISKLFRL